MLKAGTKYRDGTAAAHSLQFVDYGVRMVLAIAAEMDREVRQLDVTTAFLYADIEEDVFVAKPPGFETQGKNGVPFLMKLGKLSTGWLKAP